MPGDTLPMRYDAKRTLVTPLDLDQLTVTKNKAHADALQNRLDIRAGIAHRLTLFRAGDFFVAFLGAFFFVATLRLADFFFLEGGRRIGSIHNLRQPAD